MKKIDLHIHTKKSISDSAFSFSVEKLEEYVTTLSIDCIAITNHNLFDFTQFINISKQLTIKVLPGIEINLEKGHLLLIGNDTDIDDFDIKCKKVEAEVNSPTEFITVAKLIEIFIDLGRYLLIPHYDKKPIIQSEVIEALKPFISAGEVASPKKFHYCIKDKLSLVPVLFSDQRFSNEMSEFSARQTFISTDDVSLKSIKLCLLDKNKVFLSQKGGQSFFQIFENGQVLSAGLNVILGERSSGKSFTLRKIFNSSSNVKHIRQFELLESDDGQDVEKFDKLLTAKQSNVSESYLKEFKGVLDDVAKINRKENEKKVEKFIESLLKVAGDEEKKDVYSQAALYNESKYSESDNLTLKNLISSVELLIENIEYSELIDKHVSKVALSNLILDLIYKYNELQELNLRRSWINSISINIKLELQSFSASTSVEELDFCKIKMDNEKLIKFNNITDCVKAERIIEQNDIRKFKIIASTRKFKGASELLKKNGKKMVFSEAFNLYNMPIEYLEALKEIQFLESSEYWKYFVDVEYKILNSHGAEVSGGERSEFNLLEKIQNAHHYDMLLIDEPESSFDNLFLKNEVNEQIREISKSIPVVIVTHNSTVGASIKPDFLLYTKKELLGKNAVYKLYSGAPSDKVLKTVSGEEIANYNIMLNCLEAGEDAYSERNRTYEILKN